MDFWVYLDSGLTAEAEGDSDVTVPYGNKATLQVSASANEGVGITYQWYKWETDEEGNEQAVSIEKETGSSYETEEITQYTRYYCEVTDSYGNTASVKFTVIVSGGDVSDDDKTPETPEIPGESSQITPDNNNSQQGNDTSNSNQQKDNNKLVTKLKLSGMSKKIAAGKKITLTPSFSPADATNQK